MCGTLTLAESGEAEGYHFRLAGFRLGGGISETSYFHVEDQHGRPCGEIGVRLEPTVFFPADSRLDTEAQQKVRRALRRALRDMIWHGYREGQAAEWGDGGLRAPARRMSADDLLA